METDGRISLEHRLVFSLYFTTIFCYASCMYTRKMVPITGRARSFLLFSEFSQKNREEGETE